jgi:hypothetical protein
MQVLDVSSSVGSSPAVPLTACFASVGRAVDPSSCSVIVHNYNASAVIDNSLDAGSILKYKVMVDPLCTLDRVYAGLCSACTAAAATAGMCPPGTHTFVTDVVLPGGLGLGASLAMAFHVGSSLISAEEMIQFEVISDTRGLSLAGSEGSMRLQSMLVSSQVCHMVLTYYVRVRYR